jgi:Histidine kinase-, DNA gyrase B-, and HSP90-like ATPase
VSGDDSINIRPGVGILGIFPHISYKAWYALGELVDNAIDSYLHSRALLREIEGDGYILRIVINVNPDDGGEIRVWDNAAGINTNDYTRAFVTAEPPPDSAGLSQFGIGMKSASCWFARKWTVTTTALGEAVERTVLFDVPLITASGTESLKPESVPVLMGTHFTEVRLWDLYKPPQTQTIAKMRRHLASMYRDFLRRGDIEILFNGDPIKYEEPEVMVAKRWDDSSEELVTWKKEIDFTLPTGERVCGFAALRETGSTRFAGFSLFRHGRLIVGSDDDTYRPATIFGGSNSYRYQRLFGELNLDSFDVSHTKDSFIWGEAEEVMLAMLKVQLDAEPLPLLMQAEGFRSRKAAKDFEEAAARAIASTTSSLQKVSGIIEEQVEVGPAPEELPIALDEEQIFGQRTLNISVRGKVWNVTVELSQDESDRDWLQITDAPQLPNVGERELGICVSISHPFTQRYGGANGEGIDALVRLGAAIAIGEITAREIGISQAGTIRRVINELLRSLS